MSVLVPCQVIFAPLKAAFTVREKQHWEVTGLSRVEFLLAQMDEVYARLQQRLEGLTDVEYLWEPVPGCWTVHRDEAGAWITDYAWPDPEPAPFTTIGWRLLHIADCKVMYHEWAFGPRASSPSPISAALTRSSRRNRPPRRRASSSYGLIWRESTDDALDAPRSTNWANGGRPGGSSGR